ncbi:MAG: hypothetical protein CK548_01350 [Opitutia bacterium]|nr:class I SAM-dependent methyltransferase [Opitutaceae bacterium]PHX73398.1 MAG: hypothetical protein CK548_01350 [Opitutae bacterium]
MPAATSPDRPVISSCPVCGGREFRPFVSVGPYSVVRCSSCRLAVTNPQPSDRELGEIYGPDYVLVENDPVGEAMVLRSKRATADHYLDLLASAGVKPTGQLLEIGCGAGNFLRQADARGFAVTGLEYSPFAAERARTTLAGRGRVLHGEIGVLAAEHDAYDVVVLCDVIEHVRDPAAFLRAILRLLKPGGTLLVVTPSLDSWSARVLASRWMEFKAEHLYYFSPSTITRQLQKTDYDRIALHSGTKKLCLDYIAAHFKKYPVSLVTPLVSCLHALTPAPLSARIFSVVASGLVALARKPGAPS